MKIKALKTIVGSYGRIIRDGYGEVDAETGKKLITKGYAVEQDDAQAEQETADSDNAPQDVVVTATIEPDNAPVIEQVVVETVAEPVTEPVAESDNAPKAAKRAKKEKPDADNEGS